MSKYKTISKVSNVKKTLSQWPQKRKKGKLDTSQKTIARVVEKHPKNTPKNASEHAIEAL